MDIKLLKAMVIGDGCIHLSNRNCVNYDLIIAHSMKQKRYLLWKRDILERMGLKCRVREYETVVNPATGKRGMQMWLQTRTHPVLTALRHLMYPKTKGFPRGVLDDFGPRELSIIFMDDGTTLRKRKDRATWNGKRWIYPHRPYISAFRFCLESHGLKGCKQFARWLKRRFGFSATVLQHQGSYVVHIARVEDKRKFKRIVRRHLHSDLKYKIEGEIQYRSSHRERLSARASING